MRSVVPVFIAAVAIAASGCADRNPTSAASDGPNRPRFAYYDDVPCDYAPGPTCTQFTNDMRDAAWNLGFDIYYFATSSLCQAVGESLMNMANRQALYTRPTGGYVDGQFAVGRWVAGEVAFPYQDTDAYYQGGEAWVAQTSSDFWFDVTHEAAHAVFDPNEPGKLLTDANAQFPSSITAQQAATQCY